MPGNFEPMSTGPFEPASAKDQEEWALAPTDKRLPGHLIWVCGACQKTSVTRSGWNGGGERVGPMGWDVSCAANAVLCLRR